MTAFLEAIADGPPADAALLPPGETSFGGMADGVLLGLVAVQMSFPGGVDLKARRAAWVLDRWRWHRGEDWPTVGDLAAMARAVTL